MKKLVSLIALVMAMMMVCLPFIASAAESKTLNIISWEGYVDEDTIILRKHDPACVFCGGTKNIVSYRGKNICSDCAKELHSEG